MSLLLHLAGRKEPWSARPPRRCSAVARVWLLGIILIVSACDRAPPLPPELEAIKCPTNRQEHASAIFANARVTFVCISEQLAKNPTLLRCDLNSQPMVCEDDGTIVFSRSAEGEVYSGLLPEEVRRRDASAPGLSGSSRLTLNFRGSSLRRSTFEDVETSWRFMLPEAKGMLPSDFTFVKGALCDRNATALNSGGCNLEARSASLYWRIAVEIHADRGTPVTVEQYRGSMAFWLKLLEKLVDDPAK